MSRFDRRLKGTGLRPGQSTNGMRDSGGSSGGRCGNSPNLNQYATMSWTGNVVSMVPTPSYNPNIPQYVAQQQQQQQQQQMQQQMQQENQQMRMVNNNTATVRMMDKSLDYNQRMSDLDALAVKNARLEEAEKTAPNQQMRLITRHEIRLNTLEALTLKMEHLEMIQNGCARMNSLDDKMIEDLKNDLWAQLKSRHDVEVQTRMMGLQDEVVDLKMKLAKLQLKLGVKEDVEESEPVVKKSNQITLNIEEESTTVKEEEKEEDEKEEVSNQDEDIKKVVQAAIMAVEQGAA